MTYEIHGRVPRKGPATGTIRVFGSLPMPDIGPLVCDSKVSWNAEIDKWEGVIKAAGIVAQ